MAIELVSYCFLLTLARQDDIQLEVFRSVQQDADLTVNTYCIRLKGGEGLGI